MDPRTSGLLLDAASALLNTEGPAKAATRHLNGFAHLGCSEYDGARRAIARALEECRDRFRARMSESDPQTREDPGRLIDEIAAPFGELGTEELWETWRAEELYL